MIKRYFWVSGNQKVLLGLMDQKKNKRTVFSCQTKLVGFLAKSINFLKENQLDAPKLKFPFSNCLFMRINHKRSTGIKKIVHSKELKLEFLAF